MPLLYHAYVYLEFLILACTIYILAPLASARPSSLPLKFAPHKRPSRRTLNNYACFYCETLTKAPQQVWQTLNKFDYP